MDGVSGADGAMSAFQVTMLRKVLDMAGNQVLRLLQATPAAQKAANPPHLGQSVDAGA